jgi:hypothetical protein
VGELEAGGVLLHRRAPELVHRAVGERHGEGAHVRPRGAVLERPRAARVRRHGAAHRALLLARRVGREEQPALGRHALDVAEQRAGLGADHPGARVDVEHPVHRPQRQDHPAVRQRAARVAGERARRRDGRAPGVRLAQHGHDLVRRGGAGDGLGEQGEARSVLREALAHAEVGGGEGEDVGGGGGGHGGGGGEARGRWRRG